MHEDDGTDVLLSISVALAQSICPTRMSKSLALPTSSNVVPVTLALTFSARPAAGEPLVSAFGGASEATVYKRDER